MDPSAASLWFSQMEMEDDVFNNDECNIMDYFDEFQMSVLLEEDLSEHTCPESNSINSSSTMIIPRNDSTSTICTSAASIEPPPPPPPPPPPVVSVCAEKPAKQQRSKTNSPMILTFGNPTVPEINIPQHHIVSGSLNSTEQVLVSEVLISSASYGNLEEAAAKKTCGRKRPQSQNYDHILAERKRREQLSQQFVALSAIVPGLKKMDKTSVLGDAINYLKHLQERVRTFEENSTKQTMESLVIVKKNQVFVEDEGSSDEMGGGGGGGSEEQSSSLPEIEAKVCDKSVLIKVLCHKNKGVLVNLLSETEKLNLTVTNTNVAQFGSLALDITIIAQMEQEFNISIKDLILRLQSAVQLSSQGE